MRIQDFLQDPRTIARLNATIQRAFEHRHRGGRGVARILIADDDPLLRLLLKRRLEGAGHEVASAENGREALRLIEEQPAFDLVITDILMPELDGLELIRELRRRTCPPRIIALSAQEGREGYLPAALHFGADLALIKPRDLDDLPDVVQKLLLS